MVRRRGMNGTAVLRNVNARSRCVKICGKQKEYSKKAWQLGLARIGAGGGGRTLMMLSTIGF